MASLILLSFVFLSLLIFSAFCFSDIIHRIRVNIAIRKEVRSEGGFILIDSLIGMIILSTAVIALLAAFTQATKGTTSSTNRTQATYLAQQTLENLKAQDGSRVIDTTVSPVGKYTIVIDTPPVVAITAGADHLSTYLIPYQVTVSWSDPTGAQLSHNVRMVGYCYVNP